MNIISLSVIKDGSTSYATAQVRALDAENIKLAYTVTNNKTLPIADISLTLNTIAVPGDLRSVFLKNKSITISGGTDNDGTYTIKFDATYDNTNTVIVLTETLTSTEALGDASIDTIGTEVFYLDKQSAEVKQLTVEEGINELYENSTVLISLSALSIDGITFEKTVLLNSFDSLTNLSPNDDGTLIYYNFGKGPIIKEIQVSNTVATIQAKILAAETQTPSTTPQNYDIVDVNITLNSFGVSGDHTDVFTDTTGITVVGGAHAGTYTISGDSTFDGVNTVIVVTANITVGTIAGYIHLT